MITYRAMEPVGAMHYRRIFRSASAIGVVDGESLRAWESEGGALKRELRARRLRLPRAA